jgi:hypothetical protein
MFLLLLKYKVPIEQVERVTPAHREFLDQGYRAEKLLVSGPRHGPAVSSSLESKPERRWMRSFTKILSIRRGLPIMRWSSFRP